MPRRRAPKAKNPSAPGPAAPPNAPGAPSPVAPPPPGFTEIVTVAPGPGAAGDVEAAVAAINAIYVVGALDTALAIGDYVLKVYLGGDAAQLAQGEQAPSLRKLAEHPGLGFPATTLWYALAVYRQYPLLPELARRNLTYTHQRLLLPVTSRQAKVRLATEAVRQKWPTRTLWDAVDRWLVSHGLPPIGGYPPHPALVACKRAASATLRTARALEHGPRPAPDELREIDRQATLIAKRLARLRRALEGAGGRPQRPLPPARRSRA